MSPSEQKLMTCNIPESAAKQQLPIPPSAEVTAEASKRRAFRAHDWADKIASLPVTPTTKLVARALAKHWNAKTGQCNPKQQTLARELHVEEDTIYRAIRALRQIGRLDVDHKRGNRASYRLLEPLPEPDQHPVLDLPEPDVHPVLEPDEHPVPTRTAKRNYEESRRPCSSDAVAHAPEPELETTTTNVPPLDAEAEEMLDLWEGRVGERRGADPLRLPQATADAQRLVDAGIGVPQFTEVLTAALEQGDQFTQRNWLCKFPSVRCFQSTQANQAVDVRPLATCFRCEEKYRANDGSQTEGMCEPCDRAERERWEADAPRRQAEAEHRAEEERQWREDHPIRECVINGCQERFHASEEEHNTDTYGQMCPHCRSRLRQATIEDTIPWEDAA